MSMLEGHPAALTDDGKNVVSFLMPLRLKECVIMDKQFAISGSVFQTLFVKLVSH